MNDLLTVACPAKVNLALSVGAPREDGYHPIASWMVTIGLADQLTLQKTDGESSFDIAWADDALSPCDIDWPLGKDLIYRAHGLLEAHTGKTLPIHATLTKRIPVGAGLAGGSTDGAAMFKGLNQLFALGLDDATLIDLSMQLGSDLAFFFSPGSAIVTGRGEHLTDAAMPSDMHLALILPDFGCPTGAVYQAFDSLLPQAAVDKQAVHGAVAGNRDCFNDLAEAACAVQPRLADLRARISQATRRPVHVTGSGAGMFIVTASAHDANDLSRIIRDQCSVSAIPVAVGALV